MIRALRVVALALPLCAAGCAPTTEAGYKTLSFFFDGVPKPGAAEPGAGVPAAQAAETSKPAKTVYAHGPFAAKDCAACHLPQTNAMRAPREELCLYCHDMRLTKKYVHEPFSSGDCRSCHNPHSSPYRYMLSAAPATLCVSCHDRGSSDDHRGADNCLDCHDAHMSDEEYLLD